MIMIKKLLNFRNNWTNKDTKEEREEKRFEKNEKEDKIEEDIKVRIRKVSWVQYGGERFGRLADGQSLSSRFNWNKGCHIENLSKVMWLAAAKGGRWRKMEGGLPGNLGHRGQRYFPGLSRTIKLVRHRGRE